MAISKAMIVFPLLCFLFSTISTLSHPNTLVCNETEKRALLSFKHALFDPAHRLSSWSTHEDCCGWNGVYCHNITGRVIKLDLTNLSCVAPIRILNYLDLSGNDFGGIPIPSFLGSMRSLTYLDLYYASFCGLIPPQLGNLSNLQHLSLGSGYSFYEPQLYVENLGWISHLSSLEYLVMYEVDLQRELHWLKSTSMLSSLSELYLVACELDNMSPSLGYVNFTSLTVLSLSWNHFNHEIPNWLFNLPLNSLGLSYNHLIGQIPEYLGNLSSLTILSLNGNRLNGSLPSRLWLLSNLEYLYIGNNSLEGTISEVHFNKLSKLKYLDMSSTSLIFKVKSNWVPAFQLEELWMSTCQIGPKFPTWIQTQTSLQYLDISKSGIVDIAPKWFWKWASHIDLLIDLSDNQISGNLSGVQLNNTYIDLSSNCFMGELPRLSPQVSVLKMANNSFSGPISLSCAKIEWKNLSGELSHCWTYWQSLTHLNLGNNNLSGKIPDSMGSLFELEALHLHNNRLSGDIPPSLRNCKSLGLLDLGGNKLSGNLPSWMGEWTTLVALSLRSNKLIGNIPPQICWLSSLIILDGSEYGSILKFVRSIDLSSNDFLSGLESLNLSCNNLMGSIPEKMGSMKALESLDLSRNHLSEDEDFQGKDVIDENEEGSEIPWFYIGMGLGFIVGFWEFVVLFIQESLRHAYFQFLYRVKDWVYVAIAIRYVSQHFVSFIFGKRKFGYDMYV
ncbi:hypothetical protein AAG906_016601 [Vitis piasezkii]